MQRLPCPHQVAQVPRLGHQPLEPPKRSGHPAQLRQVISGHPLTDQIVTDHRQTPWRHLGVEGEAVHHPPQHHARAQDLHLCRGVLLFSHHRGQVPQRTDRGPALHVHQGVALVDGWLEQGGHITCRSEQQGDGEDPPLMPEQEPQDAPEVDILAAGSGRQA